jgi:aspartyl-tRNA(Asn)/glutamyl-tRNA(Gln) amidotransferase subunit A
VAAGLCFVATGTDTGSSIRSPAALCGVVGIKPTYGLVSRRGVVPLAWSLDHAGPLARRVEDAALALEAMAGFDPQDPGSADRIVPRLAEAARRPEARGVRVGLLRDFSFQRCAPPVRAAGADVARRLERLGARVEELPAPGLELVYAAYFPIYAAEFAAALADARRRHPPEAFGADVRLQLTLGEAVPAVRYLRAQRLRARVQRQLGALFARADVVLTAVTAVPAPPIGAEQVEIDGEPVSVLEALVRFNMPWNLTGLPALSLPAARDEAGLPVGVQLVAAPFAERTLLRVAAALEADLEESVPPTSASGSRRAASTTSRSSSDA